MNSLLLETLELGRLRAEPVASFSSTTSGLLFVAFFLSLVVTVSLFNVTSVLASEKRSTEIDNPPLTLKVYSRDGRESLTALCTAKDSSVRANTATEVTCKFVHVRFNLPDKTDFFPRSAEEATRFMTESSKNDPILAEEIKKNRRWKEEVERGFTDGISEVKRDLCSPKSETKTAFETKMRDPQIGPKRKRLYQELFDACFEKDLSVFASRFANLVGARTCTVWVDAFSLDFKKIGAGRWLYTQEKPGGISNALKVYELTADGSLWNLIETRIPTGNTKDPTPQRTVWSWKNYSEYELPPQCDFISHKWVQVQLP